MENNRKQTLEQIAALFVSQDLAVLSTRKYDHLTANPPVAILVNDSQNEADDIYRAPTTAFICVAMHRYYMVSRFQNVVELEITP